MMMVFEGPHTTLYDYLIATNQRDRYDQSEELFDVVCDSVCTDFATSFRTIISFFSRSLTQASSCQADDVYHGYCQWNELHLECGFSSQGMKHVEVTGTNV